MIVRIQSLDGEKKNGPLVGTYIGEDNRVVESLAVLRTPYGVLRGQ